MPWDFWHDPANGTFCGFNPLHLPHNLAPGAVSLELRPSPALLVYQALLSRDPQGGTDSPCWDHSFHGGLSQGVSDSQSCREAAPQVACQWLPPWTQGNTSSSSLQSGASSGAWCKTVAKSTNMVCPTCSSASRYILQEVSTVQGI